MLPLTILALQILPNPPIFQPPILQPVGYDLIINVLQNAGFENTSLSPWTTAGSTYYNPDGEDDDPMSFSGSRYTGMKRSGSASFDFGVNSNSGPLVINSQVAQTLGTPINVSDIANGYVYAWSPAGFFPDTLNVQIDYTDGSHSYASFNVANSQYDYSSAQGWQKCDFFPKLVKGKTVTKLTFSLYSGSYMHSELWMDDAWLGRKVHIP